MKVEPGDIAICMVVWSFSLLIAALCVCGSWLVIRWSFSL